MRVFDPHIDIADMAKYIGFSIDDFYSSSRNIPVSLDMIQKAEIGVVGLSLYYDQELVKSSFYDGVKRFYSFYQELLSRSDCFKRIDSSTSLQKLSPEEIGYFFSIEGLDCLRTPADFEEFYELGVRSFGFTWDNDNRYACGLMSHNDRGISAEGFEVLDLMNVRKDLVLDVTHLSRKSIRDLDNNYNGALIASHSNVQSVCNHPHNLSDETIQAIVDRDGVVGLFPLVACVGPDGSFEEFYQHLEYISSRWGIEHVGVCSDIYPLPEYPFCESYENILIMQGLQEFLRGKLKEEELEAVLYKNWERVFLRAL